MWPPSQVPGVRMRAGPTVGGWRFDRRGGVRPRAEAMAGAARRRPVSLSLVASASPSSRPALVPPGSISALWPQSERFLHSGFSTGGRTPCRFPGWCVRAGGPFGCTRHFTSAQRHVPGQPAGRSSPGHVPTPGPTARWGRGARRGHLHLLVGGGAGGNVAGVSWRVGPLPSTTVRESFQQP